MTKDGLRRQNKRSSRAASDVAQRAESMGSTRFMSTWSGPSGSTCGTCKHWRPASVARTTFTPSVASECARPGRKGVWFVKGRHRAPYDPDHDTTGVGWPRRAKRPTIAGAALGRGADGASAPRMPAAGCRHRRTADHRRRVVDAPHRLDPSGHARSRSGPARGRAAPDATYRATPRPSARTAALSSRRLARRTACSTHVTLAAYLAEPMTQGASSGDHVDGGGRGRGGYRRTGADRGQGQARPFASGGCGHRPRRPPLGGRCRGARCRVRGRSPSSVVASMP